MMDVDKLILVVVLYCMHLSFGAMMDVDKLILEEAMELDAAVLGL